MSPEKEINAVVREQQSQGRVKSEKFLKGTATNLSAAMLAKSCGPFAMTLGLWKKNKPYREEVVFPTAQLKIPLLHGIFPPFMCTVLGWISLLCWLP